MKNITLLLLFLSHFSSISLVAQFEPEELISTNNSLGVYTFTTTDFNGDNDVDIVYYSASNDKICFSENIFPEEYFKPSITLIDSIYSVNFMTSGDIDHDGDIDLAYSREDFNSVYWLENEGNLTFENPQIISDNLMKIMKLELADLNGDGNLDIVTVSQDDHKIAWFEKTNDASGYGNEIIISSNLIQARDVGVNDLDNDGDMDIVACSQGNGQILWYENLDGLGSFSVGNLIGTLGDVRQIMVKDVDLDGYIDILAGSYTEDKFIWFQNLGGFGIFSGELPIVNYNGFSNFDIADMDTDGDMDFVISSYNNSSEKEIIWYENENNNFSNPRLLHSNRSLYFSITDLNNDNLPDVVTPLPSGFLSITNTGDAESFSKRTIELPFIDYCDLVVGDVNNDGLNDVVTASSLITFYQTISIEPYRFRTRTPFSVLGNTTVFHKVDLRDLDDDNDLDLVYCSQYGLYWRENDGSGGFSNGAAIDFDEYHDFEISDLDADGDLDIISSTGNVVWWENNDGVFEISSEVFNYKDIFNYAEVNIEIGDLDNDGDNDIVTALQTTPIGVYWFENDGQGIFSDTIILSTSIDCQGAKITDINGDGNLDIMVSEFSGSIYWFQGDGEGNFSTQIKIDYDIPDASSGADSYALDVGDIDLDGDIDILVSDSKFGTVLWLENTDGLGTFSEIIIIHQLPAYPYSAKLYDLNQDGDLDVFTGRIFDQNRVSYYENTSFFVSTDELEKAQEPINIFPNPVNNYFYIQPTLSKLANINYRIYNNQGVQIMEGNEMVFPENSIQVNVQNLSSGLYILELAYENKIISGKIIIQK